jgi:phosphate transport system protein
LDNAREHLDSLAIDVLARQQPVATDLRTVVTALRMSGDLERMGDLARHVAKVARLRFPELGRPAVIARPTSCRWARSPSWWSPSRARSSLLAT